ncbi:AAA family ATPase [Rhodococcus aetherivorans]|uniref:AAA family ATPase n=1 Tax=Rhodococcus aetherivorans TaxID=191292 RepID=UPI00163B1F43|nr:AAA family ATPase [Rhodococcus aetherivorans]MBC2586929.1 AAA family ATPase [Rhodococcus aetherivorans]
MADIADYNHEPTVDPRRLRLRANRPAVEPEPAPAPEPVAEDIADPYGVGVEALAAVDEPITLTSVPPTGHSALFDEAASPALSQPARWGWRGRINAALGTKLAPTPDSAETGHRAAVEAIGRTLPGAGTVAVVNTKGGAGKTPTTIALAAMLGKHRGRGVVAVDMSEAGGTLGIRAARTAAVERTVWDVLANASRLMSGDVEAGELAAYLRLQPTHDEILAGDTDSSCDDVLGENECAALGAVLRRHRDLLIIDTATTAQAGAWQWAVRHADVLVVPLPMRRDMAQHAYAMLDGLRKRGLEHLVRSAIVLLCAAPGSDPNLETVIVDEFDSLGVQTYVRVPFEPVFATGERITLEALSQSSILAWTNVAALVTDALAEAIVERQTGLRQQSAPAAAEEATAPRVAAQAPSVADPDPTPVPAPASTGAVDSEPARSFLFDYRPCAGAPPATPEIEHAADVEAEVHQPPAPSRRPQPPKPSSFNPYA